MDTSYLDLLGKFYKLEDDFRALIENDANTKKLQLKFYGYAFYRLSKKVNIQMKSLIDGKNLANVVATRISTTQNTKLVPTYYKLLNEFVEIGINPNEKDHKNLSAIDYILKAEKTESQQKFLEKYSSKKLGKAD